MTASSSGIGFEIARKLAGEGAAVIINGRTSKTVAYACEEIKSGHPGAKLIRLVADNSTDVAYETAENRPTSLIARLIRTEEIASFAAYLCSPLSSAINGACMRVDGGLIRSIVRSLSKER